MTLSKSLKVKLGMVAALFSFAALLLFVVLGPFISLYGIQTSLDKGQHDKLARYIDFPVLQDNIKIKIQQQAQTSLGFDFSESTNLLAQFAMNFANQIISTAVESAVSPTGIGLMLSGQDLNDLILQDKQAIKISEDIQKTTRQNNKKSLYEYFQESRFDYVSHKEFIFYLPAKDTDKEAGRLIFLRNGICWKLSDVYFAQ